VACPPLGHRQPPLAVSGSFLCNPARFKLSKIGETDVSKRYIFFSTFPLLPWLTPSPRSPSNPLPPALPLTLSNPLADGVRFSEHSGYINGCGKGVLSRPALAIAHEELHVWENHPRTPLPRILVTQRAGAHEGPDGGHPGNVEEAKEG
jgi:hypothetical protein